MKASGDSYRTQRVLEMESLNQTIKHFKSSEDVFELSQLMFKHWIAPQIFSDSFDFFASTPVPIYIVSNIDSADIKQALLFHNLKPAGVFTSEDARTYKPNKELFELALRSTALLPSDVVHIGDSIISDIRGASRLGIKAIWLNRKNKDIPPDMENSVQTLIDVFNLPSLKTFINQKAIAKGAWERNPPAVPENGPDDSQDRS